ncbi:Flp family type IVb pilin [Microvirga sp. 0TCS3.31]
MQHAPAPRCRDERGATAVEYGLMIAFLALAIAASVTSFGQAVAGLFGLIPPEVWP